MSTWYLQRGEEDITYTRGHGCRNLGYLFIGSSEQGWVCQVIFFFLLKKKFAPFLKSSIMLLMGLLWILNQVHVITWCGYKFCKFRLN